MRTVAMKARGLIGLLVPNASPLGQATVPRRVGTVRRALLPALLAGCLLASHVPVGFAQSISFGVATSLGPSSGPRSVAIGDLDGDGKSDLAVANQSSNSVSVRLGNGNGTFKPPT